MKSEENLCLKLYKITIGIKEDYFNNLEIKIGDTFKFKICPCLEIFAKNLFLNAKIIMYICEEKDSKCKTAVDIVHSLLENKIYYNLEELMQYKVTGRNLGEDALEILISILNKNGFEVLTTSNIHRGVSKNDVYFDKCRSNHKTDNQVTIHWDEKSAIKKQ